MNDPTCVVCTIVQKKVDALLHVEREVGGVSRPVLSEFISGAIALGIALERNIPRLTHELLCDRHTLEVALAFQTYREQTRAGASDDKAAPPR